MVSVKKVKKPLGGFLALVGDDGGQGEAAAGSQGSGGGGSGQLGGHCTSGKDER
jgi:hypothetical protein